MRPCAPLSSYYPNSSRPGNNVETGRLVKRFSLVFVAALAALLLAVPVSAQEDPYGEVLPGDETRPGDEIVRPDGSAPGPGAGDAQGDSVAPGPGAGDAQGDSVAPPAGVAAAGQRANAAGQPGAPGGNGRLPVTGEFTIGLLLLALSLLAGGTGALLLARRRRATHRARV